MEWESKVSQLRTEVQLQKQAAEQAKTQAEEEELRKLRSQAVHRAQPVRSYKPLEIHPSDVPLTVAKTPCFSERLKARTAKH